MRPVELTLPPALAERAATSGVKIVKDLPSILRDLVRLRRLVDRPFQCRETPREVFDSKLTLVRTAREINAIYWRDMASAIKAYCLSTTWRIMELAEDVLLLSHQFGVLGPAVIARSLVELSIVYILNGSAIRDLVIAASAQWREKVILSEDLEVLLDKALYGSRLVPEGDPLRQTNILTQMQKLTKYPGFEDVRSYYERLCEIAHPNMAGNARFWTDVVTIEPDGTRVRVGAASVNNEAVAQVMDDTLWALGWSVANCIAGFEILNAQVETIRRAYSSPTDAT